MKPMVDIDGSLGEGGGQILRTSLSLSVLTRQPVQIERIRAGRSKPGLQPQHLAAVRAAAALCAASLEGAEVGSTHLRFAPQSVVAPGTYHFDIGTAGAAPLVVQTILLPLAFAGGDSRVAVTGGTHVPHAPTVEYLESVYGGTLARCGLVTTFRSPSAGFYPRGGGLIHVGVSAVDRLQPVDLVERGALKSLTGYVITARLPVDVAVRGRAIVQKMLHGLAVPLTIETHDVLSAGPGAAVVLIAEHAHGLAGFSAIGARGKPMEAVAEEACAAFHSWYNTGAGCEEHLADQLALLMALVPAESRWRTSRVTDHLRTVLAIVSQFLPVAVDLKEEADGTGVVALRGTSMASGAD